MVSGIEEAGLALAFLPLLVQQLDTYVLGIHKLSRMRRYRKEFKHYSALFSAQQAILQTTLENTLKGIVHDRTTAEELINDPIDKRWKDHGLQQRLRTKLGRGYEPFTEIMAGLADMIRMVAAKMGISIPDMKITHQSESRVWWRYLLHEPIYKSLLDRMDDANAILKTLYEQSRSSEKIGRDSHPWGHLLPRYKRARKQAEELFKSIVAGNRWTCGCIEHHNVHYELQSQPFHVVNGRFQPLELRKPRILFSNGEQATDSWKCGEFEFERYTFGQRHAAPVVGDFCSCLRLHQEQATTGQIIGILSCEPHSPALYGIQATGNNQPYIPQLSLEQHLSRLSRRERIHIAAALACGVIQLWGSWLKPRWRSSDIHLAVDDRDGTSLGFFLLTWPLSESISPLVFQPSTVREDVLVPLGRALVELSVGQPSAGCAVEDGEVEKFETAMKLVEIALHESGSNYADAVRSCFFWADKGSLCSDAEAFQERIFDTVVSPLLRDLVHFEDTPFDHCI